MEIKFVPEELGNGDCFGVWRKNRCISLEGTDRLLYLLKSVQMQSRPDGDIAINLGGWPVSNDADHQILSPLLRWNGTRQTLTSSQPERIHSKEFNK